MVSLWVNCFFPVKSIQNYTLRYNAHKAMQYSLSSYTNLQFHNKLLKYYRLVFYSISTRKKAIQTIITTKKKYDSRTFILMIHTAKSTNTKHIYIPLTKILFIGKSFVLGWNFWRFAKKMLYVCCNMMRKTNTIGHRILLLRLNYSKMAQFV